MVNHMKDIKQMQEDAEKRYKEVLETIEALSDTTSSDRASSVWEFQSSEKNNQ
jgi:DnaJ-class molecular chaperone